MGRSLALVLLAAGVARADVSIVQPGSSHSSSCVAAINAALRKAHKVVPEIDAFPVSDKWFHYMHDGRYLDLWVFPSPSAAPSLWERFNQDGVIHHVRHGVGRDATLTIQGWDEESVWMLEALFTEAADLCLR